MLVTFDLPQEQIERIESARAQGVDVDTLLKNMVDTLPLPKPHLHQKISQQNRDLIALLHEWNVEDETDETDEQERRKQEGEAFSANLQANRVNFRVTELID